MEGRRGHLFTRKFAARIKQVVKADGRKLAPYSLRHNFRTSLTRAGVPSEIADRLMGHAAKGVGLRVYSHGESIEQLAEAVEKIDAAPVEALVTRVMRELL